MSAQITVVPRQTEGLPALAGDYRSASVTVSEARLALARMVEQSPEHQHLAEVVSALLVRLDTIRDEAHFSASLARRRVDAGDLHAAGRSIDNVLSLVDRRGARHHLLILSASASAHGGPL